MSMYQNQQNIHGRNNTYYLPCAATVSNRQFELRLIKIAIKADQIKIELQRSVSFKHRGDQQDPGSLAGTAPYPCWRS